MNIILINPQSIVEPCQNLFGVGYICVEVVFVVLQPIFGNSRMAEQEAFTIYFSQICQLKKIIVVAKELLIERCLLVVVPVLTQMPVQHITAVVITYQQMHAVRMLLFDIHQFFQWSKHSFFMKVITRIWVQIIPVTYNLSTLIYCFT